MAQQTIVEYIDDITGEKGDDVQTVTFGLDGRHYEIDLNLDNHDKLTEILNPYIQAGRRRRSGDAKRVPRGSSGARSDDTAKIRTWAKENGYEINDRGRVPADIREAYEKVHRG